MDQNQLIDRYIDDVTRRLPQGQREDVGRELRSLIEDMLEAPREGISGEESVRAVLQELGEPRKLADKYREQKNFLIGPQLWEDYWLVVKIVLECVAAGIFVASVVDVVTTPDLDNVIALIAKSAANMFMGLVQAFAWVTIVFACMEAVVRKKGTVIPLRNTWTPDDLPPVASKKTLIKRGEPIVGIVFSTLFLFLLCFAPQLFSVYTIQDGQLFLTPVFHLSVWRNYIGLVVICILLGIAKEVLYLISGRYTVKVAVTSCILSLAAMCAAVVIFSNHAIWNPDLVQSLTQYWQLEPALANKLSAGFESLKSVVPGVFLLAYGIEIAVTAGKGVQAAKECGGSAVR